MAEVTPNLGLKKPLESEFVSIQTLNENMNKVDQSLGPVSELPTSAKNTVGAISEIYDQLAHKPHEQLTVTPGVQIVQGGDVPAILHPTMQGRTLVNLLGREGLSGRSSFSISNFNVTTGTHYLFAFEILNFEGSGVVGIAGDVSGGLSRTGLWYATLMAPDSLFNVTSYVYSGTPTFQAEKFRLYEITAAETTHIDSLSNTAAQAYIASNYPYVDDMKHVNAVYIENKGKNLLPPFSEWTTNTDTGIYQITGQYSGTLTTTSVTLEKSQHLLKIIQVIPYQDYTITISDSGNFGCCVMTEDGLTVVQNWTIGTKTFNSGNNKVVRVYFGNFVAGAGNYTFSSPMMCIGPEPLLFEPQKPSYLYLPDCNLRSNVDGSVADRLYTDGQGKPRVTRRFRETVLDGELTWTFSADYSGFKVVLISLPIGFINRLSAWVTKFNGMPLPSTATINSGGDLFTADTTKFYLSVLDTDSGWGESYTPTADEIKAYFYGWIMYNGDVGVTTPYNGTGTKWWAYRNDNFVGTISAGTVSGGTNVLPTTHAPVSKGWTDYRLMYQLAQSVDEPITYEGSLMLHEGDNQIEVGTGVVVREAANPKTVGTGFYMINVDGAKSPSYAGSELRKRAKYILRVFRNQVTDMWKMESSPNSYGAVNTYIAASNFDPAAAYSATYLALDTFALGIAPQTISAEYAPNIRESVESLVREVVEARKETSVLQNTKAQKQQPQWIAPTLRNDWIDYGVSANHPISYMKDDLGEVKIRGMIKLGAMASNTVLFYLPKGYRPKAQVTGVGQFGGATGSLIQIVISSNGAVSLGYTITSNSWLDLSGIAFMAEQ